MANRVHARTNVGFAAAAAFTLLLGVAWAQQQSQQDHGTHHPEQADASATTQPASPMSEMCKMHMDAMSKLKNTLAQAKQAAESGNSEQAAHKISEAQDLIEKQHARMHEKMQGRMGEMMTRMGEGKMKCPMCGKMMGKSGQAANSNCPMDGNKIDANRLTDATKREHQGETLGFCCSHCAGQWDQLSSAQKQAKSDAVAAGPETESPSRDVGTR